MFTAASLTTDKDRSNPVSIHRQADRQNGSTHSVQYYSALKSEILSHAARMKLEGMTVSSMSQT
jgi:hypothetical protein